METERNDGDERVLSIPQSSYEENQEGKGCCGRIVCNPRHPCHRFLALIFMCLMGFGSYFCYDNPGALLDKFKEDLQLTTSQFVMFYSIYSWPNVVMCFIGGFLVDRVFGIRLGTIIYMIILLIGVLLFATGGYINAFWLMIVGRFIFGIGGEALAVAQNNYAVRWFKGKELNMVFGWQLSFARVGSTVNFLTMEPLYKSITNVPSGPQKIGTVLFIASLTCVLSLICVLILAWMDKRADSILSQNVEHTVTEPVKITDVKNFDKTFWLVSIICVAYYVAVFPFIALGKVFFERKYDMSPESANTVNSILYMLSLVASPILGILIDKTGRNIYWIISSIILTIGAHSMLTFTFWNPYIGMVTFGLAYSALASSLWPLISLIIPEHQLGMAYGICQSVQNLGLAVVSLYTGVIVDNGGYFMLETFFLGCLCIALISASFISIIDSANQGNLNMSPAEREKYKVEQSDCKRLLQSDSATNSSIEQNDHPDLASSDRIRQRYLSKIGTHNSDLESLRH